MRKTMKNLIKMAAGDLSEIQMDETVYSHKAFPYHTHEE
jgi:hypothetical protein